MKNEIASVFDEADALVNFVNDDVAITTGELNTLATAVKGVREAFNGVLSYEDVDASRLWAACSALGYALRHGDLSESAANVLVACIGSIASVLPPQYVLKKVYP